MNSLVSSLCLGALPDVRGGSLRSLFFGEKAQISFEPPSKWGPSGTPVNLFTTSQAGVGLISTFAELQL